MSILKRFRDIMASNINAALDKLEDPSKMIDQLLRDLNDDLGQVKAETAGIMAEETRARRALDEAVAQVSKLQAYAEKAVMAGNDEDAKLFLSKKAQATENVASLQKLYDSASGNAAKMRQMHDKLIQQIADLNSRRDAIKAKVAVANAQSRINKMTESVNDSAASISAFDRMEQKADRMLDEANAMAELNADKVGDKLEDAMSRYDSTAPAVEDELAALKAKLGK
jgi:phage shock protein A